MRPAREYPLAKCQYKVYIDLFANSYLPRGRSDVDRLFAVLQGFCQIPFLLKYGCGQIQRFPVIDLPMVQKLIRFVRLFMRTLFSISKASSYLFCLNNKAPSLTSSSVGFDIVVVVGAKELTRRQVTRCLLPSRSRPCHILSHVDACVCMFLQLTACTEFFEHGSQLSSKRGKS